MYYFSHWITPEGPTRRYDTRFFVARAPDAQVPLHDDREVIANLWIRPADALAANRAGEFEMIFPTVRTPHRPRALRHRRRPAGRGRRHRSRCPAILPRIVEDEGGGVRIVLPGDPGYDDLVSALELPDGVPAAPPLPGQPIAPTSGGARHASAESA